MCEWNRHQMLKNQYNTDKSAMVNRNDEGAPSQDTVLVFQGVLSGTVYCAESPAGCRYVPVVLARIKKDCVAHTLGIRVPGR